MKTVYITFQSGKKEPIVSMLSVINHGQVLEDGRIRYLTKDGIKIQTIEEITNNNVSVVEKSKIDIKESLYYWYRRHPNNLDKPLIEDENLEMGEDYFGNSWRYGLKLLVTQKDIKYKLILE